MQLNLGTDAYILLMGGVSAFFVALLKNSELAETVVKFLVRRINKVELVNFDDLSNHNYIIKLRGLKESHYNVQTNKIECMAKLELFKKFITMLADVNLQSTTKFLNKDNLKLSDQEIKAFVAEQLIWCENEYDNKFVEILLTYNSDMCLVHQIVYKIGLWRQRESIIINSNIMLVLSSNKKSLIPYKFDTILSLQSLGIDLLISNGADSFNKLNGELKNFITHK